MTGPAITGGDGLWDVADAPDPRGGRVEGLRIFGPRPHSRWYTVRHDSDSSYDKVRSDRLYDLLRLYGIDADAMVAAGLPLPPWMSAKGNRR